MKLNVYYDLKYAPATFDFSTFLVLSNAVRQTIGSESMSVNIICNQYRNWSVREKTTTASEKRWRVTNILSRLPFLIPEVSSLDINESSLERISLPAFPGGYPPKDGAEYKMPYECSNLASFYGNDSINLRPFKSTEGAKNIIDNSFDDNVISISLRTSKFQTARNSNMKEWYKVYQELKSSKFRPIVIPDFEDYTGDKLYTKYDWEIYAPAVMDMDLRMALYEKSTDNLCVNNGINGLLIFSDCRYNIFKYLNNEVSTVSEEFHLRIHGIRKGENYKFSAPTGQNLIWEADSAEIILRTIKL